ncbi:hypothetical protein [Nitrosomonas sp. Nm166]|uniref:hypothetical protein n=1 Tax=Nitrosomonas sp. Nm166 TaxID=1881054 RepID=UPI0008F249DB|nr:hypothetical protein [Nitrosomonas sp. Nm166]SFE97021.1 twitching motility protein PilI [Nitrosomonas sp. Nm166]
MPFNLKSRILLVSPGDKMYTGFIVNSMMGIRNLSEFTPTKLAKTRLPKGITAQYQDTEERLWQKLSLHELMQDEEFLHIALE